MKLGVKLALSFSCVILLLIILSGVSIRNMSVMNEQSAESNDVRLPSVIAVQSMHTELNAVRADLAAMISQPNADELRYYE